MKLSVSPRAKADIDNVRNYWSGVNKVVAKRFVAAIRRDIGYIRRQPLCGHRLVDGSRWWIVYRTPYIISYETLGREVRIVRVLHQAQDRPSLDDVFSLGPDDE